jgi:hypothetical protein
MTATETPAERPVEFVQSLPEEQKRSVLFALLREVYAVHGDFAAIPLRDGDTDLGYLARSEDMLTGGQKILLTLPREAAARMCEPIPDDLDLDDCLSEEEVEAIHRRVEARHAQESRAAS